MVGSEEGRSGGERPRPYFLDLAPEYRDPETSAACILPVPYDETASWLKGSAEGPAALIAASNYVEVYDIETASEPYRRGIATLPPVGFSGPPDELTAVLEARVGEILDRGQLPVTLGGEHSISVGPVRAVADRTPGLSCLQIDAHADTRESYHGSRYNHACVMARVRETCPIVQVGIRSLDTSELESLDIDRVFLAQEIVAQRTGSSTAEDSLLAERPWMGRAVDPLSEDVYVTIDVDGFDPSVIPATGTPEPGGLEWYEVNALLSAVARSRRVVGFDVVELLDLPGHHASAFTAAKLVYRFLAEIFSQSLGDPLAS
jgi:agmatinase